MFPSLKWVSVIVLHFLFSRLSARSFVTPELKKGRFAHRLQFPLALVGDDGNQYQQQVLPEWEFCEPYTGTVHAVYVPGRHLALKVRVLIDHLATAQT
jgi:hypothetical protein